MTEKLPYVVMLGDVGTGKSTIVEKLTNEIGRSSGGELSSTQVSEHFRSYNDTLLLCDTPGSNAVSDKLSHNMEIAHALNHAPVWKLFVVVKADTRMENVLDGVRRYAERLLDLPLELLGVLVTHMDTVRWGREAFKKLLAGELGMDTVLFSGHATPRAQLLDDILRVCEKPHNVTVNDENFLKIFRINDNKLKILQSVNREVEMFKDMKREFDHIAQTYPEGKDKVDMMFSFQHWMEENIIQAQMKVAEENEFDFLGDEAANQAGHIANMTSQMRGVFYDLRVTVFKYQNGHSVQVARKCPYCGLIWSKFEGCDGATTCGERPSVEFDVRDPSYAIIGLFTISWSNKKLQISKAGGRTLRPSGDKKTRRYGCGNKIVWNQMQVVQVPPEVIQTEAVTMQDNVPAISPSVPGATNILNVIKKLLSGRKIKLKSKSKSNKSPK